MAVQYIPKEILDNLVFSGKNLDDLRQISITEKRALVTPATFVSTTSAPEVVLFAPAVAGLKFTVGTDSAYGNLFTPSIITSGQINIFWSKPSFDEAQNEWVNWVVVLTNLETGTTYPYRLQTQYPNSGVDQNIIKSSVAASAVVGGSYSVSVQAQTIFERTMLVDPVLIALEFQYTTSYSLTNE